MNDKELFEKVLVSVCTKYDITTKNPYNDCYVDFYKGDEYLGGLNYDGYSLLYNISRLSKLLEGELR